MYPDGSLSEDDLWMNDTPFPWLIQYTRLQTDDKGQDWLMHNGFMGTNGITYFSEKKAMLFKEEIYARTRLQHYGPNRPPTRHCVQVRPCSNSEWLCIRKHVLKNRAVKRFSLGSNTPYVIIADRYDDEGEHELATLMRRRK